IKTLAILTLTNKPELTDIATTWQEFSLIVAMKNKICFIAASDLSFPQLISATVDSESLSLTAVSVIKTTCQIPLSPAHYSRAEVIAFQNRHDQIVHANYYAPTNPDYHADKNETPPLIVISHGGPTGQSSTALDPKKQFWTSRGFAILDVNYSGSTGYGKDYRLRLDNKWGVLDVEDCCDAALYAVKKGLADKNHLIIRGSSAGGYTVLSALTFEQVFSAGASYYGISELTSLASDTHKFESRYLDRLIGPYPEAKTVYQQRSPINSAEQLDCPVIFFQGIEDKVVPKEQAEKMFDLLSKKGLTVAAQYFEGEQHGFRKAETIIHSLENELNFYRLIFNLAPRQTITFTGNIQTSNI
ncbi:MAG: S9 family peptidase, partial [Gammaproteobacteria bacterium]|nr:S9 family peptidase [Gammaproteobacteria bacterium]